MAILKKITFEGNEYYLGNKDRVSAATAIKSNWSGIVGSGSVGTGAVGADSRLANGGGGGIGTACAKPTVEIGPMSPPIP